MGQGVRLSWSAAVVHKDCLLSDAECVVEPALLLFGYLPFLVEIIYPFLSKVIG